MSQLKTSGKKAAVRGWYRTPLNGFGPCVIMGVLLVLFVLTGCSTGKRSSRLVLTPVTDSPTGLHHEGKFVWNDLLTDDISVAKAFYGELFGWTFEQLGDYTLIKNMDQGIGGMVQVGEASGTTGVARWLCSLSVSDVDKAVALLIEEGGVAHEGPLELSGRGRGALVSDPQGAQLLFLKATDGDPEDAEPVLGAWLWHELWSNKVDTSLTFYQKLAGYDFEGDANDYLVLSKDEKWRAGIRYVEDPELEMRWVPVVRVADTEAVAERAVQLGGEVLVDPMPTESGSVALLSDPSEALLIIQSWTAETSEQEVQP